MQQDVDDYGRVAHSFVAPEKLRLQNRKSLETIASRMAARLGANDLIEYA